MLDALRADVLGVTVGVVAGLLTVGLCHYRSNARVPDCRLSVPGFPQVEGSDELRT